MKLVPLDVGDVVLAPASVLVDQLSESVPEVEAGEATKAMIAQCCAQAYALAEHLTELLGRHHQVVTIKGGRSYP